MRKYIVLLLFYLLSSNMNSNASHIVGGEFELRYSGSGNYYYIYMNMYYDELHANDGLFDIDKTINISIFSKATNIRQKNISLNRISTDLINYTTNGCNNPNVLKTRNFRYVSIGSNGSQAPVDLSGLYEAQGYYISWERCCRNYESINIVHTDFFGNHISGQVFYLEFPPIVKSGVDFINSSPVFAPVPAQYLCRNNMNVISFAAQDSDGDSLVYKMVTPLKGHTTELYSQPTYPDSAPYDSIGWISGYSANNAIHGSPPLSINSKTGILSVNPISNGLYAFAVACMEYRNGVKIGEVRRDFQYLVQDCPVSYSPSVGINKFNNGSSNPGNTNWGMSTPDTILVKLNKDTCYTIFVTDSSANYYGQNDYVNIFYGASSLPKSVISFSPSRVLVTPSSDTSKMDMCFSTCDKLLTEKDSVYFLDIVVQDGDENSCNRKSDTLRVYVFVDVDENNNKPSIGTSIEPLNYIIASPDISTTFQIYGLDSDLNDIKTIDAVPFRFSMNDYNMNFNRVYNGVDSVSYLFEWTPTCVDLKKKLEYKIDFIIKDKSCIYTHSDTVRVTLRLQDVPTELGNFIPTNLITPNGDGLNDCFYLLNLPPDNCTYIFRSVKIYNRWGAKVYESSDRNFKWCPDDLSDGIYYFGIDVNVKTIKSWIQVIR